MAARVARNSSLYFLSAVAWACSRVRTSCAATFITAVPPPGVHPELALAASISWADELEPAAGWGSEAAFYGSDAAFPVRWRDGVRTTRSVLAAGSPLADCAGSKLGRPPWVAPVGGAGAASLSGTTK